MVPEVELDEHGAIVPVSTEPDAIKKRRLLDTGVGESIRRGVIRYVYLILDWSLAMDEDDFRPTRGEVVYKAVAVRGCTGIWALPPRSRVCAPPCVLPRVSTTTFTH